ncbi:MAG: OmpA family protein [Candidatus Lambdaproteobacteria bacterium]|nr:OmpA family protein [Candidatus Lambdaproteobacteria bacterium]
MPVFEEEHKCDEFTDYWIFTYGDTVTLLLTFFILLMTFCKLDVAKFSNVAESFKPTPPGSPFFLKGGESVLEGIAQRVETGDFGDQVNVTVEERGVVVSFKDSALFESGSTELSERAIKSLSRFVKFLYALPNPVLIEGHTDDGQIRTPRFPSNWELSSARAGSVARFLQREGIKGDRITVIGYAEFRPRVRNDSPERRALNRRIDVILKPD